jgi:thiazole/oxazole-forming peptide maturase SagD family component
MIAPMIIEGTVSFGETLQYPQCRSLRDGIAGLFGDCPGSLHVDVLPAMSLPITMAAQYPADNYLFLDFHRVLYFQPVHDAGAPNIDSALHYLLENYPFKPFTLLAEFTRAHPFCFSHSIKGLNILRDLKSRSVPGTLIILDFLTGEVRLSRVHEHPNVPGPSFASAESTAIGPDMPSITVSSRAANPNWRGDGKADLEELLSEDAGVIRGERFVITESSVPGSVTRIAWNSGQEEAFCGGKSFRPSHATHIGRCEASERFQLLYPRPGDPLVCGSYAELREHAVDPFLLFFERPRRHPSSWRAVYDHSVQMYWTWARDLLQQRECLVPAQDVWFNTRQLPGENICIRNTTNGCAAGTCREEAALFALMEAIERDAFMTMWYLRRRCDQIDPEHVEHDNFQLLWARMRYTLPNYRIHFFNLTTEIPVPVIAAVAVRQSGTGGRTFHSACAHPNVEHAMFTALKELAAIARHGVYTWPPSPNLQSVETVEDHVAIYTLDEFFPSLSFLDFDSPVRISVPELNQNSLLLNTSSTDLNQALSTLMERMRALGLSVLLKDLTQPGFARRNLFCVKAVTPGLYPLWFGYNEVRFSPTPRLVELAHRFRCDSVITSGDFNLDPHPFG